MSAHAVSVKSPQNSRLPKNYFRHQVSILRWVGVELEREETNSYFLYSMVALFVVVYSYTFVEGWELYANWGDLNAVANVLNYLVTHFIGKTGGSIKVFFMYLHRKKYKKIIEKIHGDMFKPNISRAGELEEEAILDVIKLTDRAFTLYGVLIFVVIMIGAVDSMHSRVTEPGPKWHLPFLNISALDTTRFPTFEIGYVYQLFCISVFAFVIISTDFVRTGIMAHVSVQLKIVRHALGKFGDRAAAMQKLPEYKEKSLEQCYKVLVKESVEHHLTILDLAKETEELCSTVVLVVMLSAVLQLCFLLYQLSLMPLNNPFVIHFFIYWCVVACQAFQYCYWGNEITLESADVARGAAEAEWVGVSNSVAKSLVLIMGRAQTPFYVTAGNFVPLSMDFFMKIVKGSFSYFMILRQMNEPTLNN